MNVTFINLMVKILLRKIFKMGSRALVKRLSQSQFFKPLLGSNSWMSTLFFQRSLIISLIL